MNDKQKLEMIAMCAQALAEKKKLQYRPYNGVFVDSKEGIGLIVQSILFDAYEFRIKPEPKTMMCRMFLTKDGYGRFAPKVAYGSWNQKAYENGNDFIEWLTDEITVELPE